MRINGLKVLLENRVDIVQFHFLIQFATKSRLKFPNRNMSIANDSTDKINTVCEGPPRVYSNKLQKKPSFHTLLVCTLSDTEASSVPAKAVLLLSLLKFSHANFEPTLII